eukprot:IDg18992t1
MKHASQLPLLPRWTFAWYALNLIVLPFDTTFILLRPTGRVADTVLASFHMYARYDAAAADPNDNVVRYIYLIGLLDIAAFIALFTILAKRPTHTTTSVLPFSLSHSPPHSPLRQFSTYFTAGQASTALYVCPSPRSTESGCSCLRFSLHTSRALLLPCRHLCTEIDRETGRIEPQDRRAPQERAIGKTSAR